jgi:hypothetical protein
VKAPIILLVHQVMVVGPTHTEPKPQRPGRRKAAVQRSADRVARLAFSSLPVLGSDDPRVVGRPDDDRRISGVSRHDVSRTTNSVHTE